MAFPQKIIPELISYLQMLERKGIKSLYLNHDPEGPAPEKELTAVASGHTEIDTRQTVNDLASLAARVAGCTDCPLHESRTKTVFGVGNNATKVLFIGEAPGRNEDMQGEPFVGRAGQLLNKILAAIELKREDVFITNILKCRPPDNRDPVESEVRCCEKYLIEQIELIKPGVICALGRIAAHWLLRTTAPLSALRLGEHSYQDIPILVTYHPAALLRNPNFKRGAWEDFKKLKAMLDSF
jgi:uracil-DNA glycosylase family 4